MQIRINEEDKIIEIWATKNESFGFCGMLHEYKRQKFTVCVYQSGSESVERLTSNLLITNL